MNNGQQTEQSLNARTNAVLGEDMDELIEDVRFLTKQWLDIRAQVGFLEQMRKVELAEATENIRTEREKQGDRVTEKLVDNLGRRSNRYRNFLERLRDAKKEKAKIEAEYYAARNRLEKLQKQLDYARAEMYNIKQGDKS